MKKLLSMVLALTMLMTTVVGLDFSAYAAGSTIYSTSSGSTVNSGSTVRIPVSIKNNSGLMGFKLMFSYDSDFLTPKGEAECADILSGGIQDNIEGDATEGSFNVYWSGSANLTGNGILFYVEFDVKSGVTGSTKIGINYSKRDTYDEAFRDVSLSCEDITLNVKDKSLSSFAKITASADDGIADGAVVLRLRLSQIFNITTLAFGIDYPSSVLELMGVTSPVSAKFNYNNVGSTINFAVTNVSTAFEDKEILDITFKVKADALSGEYSFDLTPQISALVCKDCTFKITNNLPCKIYSDKSLSVNKDATLTVPVRISNNKGIMGYRLNFEYDDQKITVTAVNAGTSFKGNLSNSIGVEGGKFSVVWNATDENTKNDILFNIVVKGVSATVDDNAVITVSYTPVDTFNGEYQSVEFSCEDIAIVLNPSCKHSYSRVVKKPTCTEGGYTTYTCSKCGDSYVDSYVDATGHTEVVDPAVAASCKATGLTQGSHCSTCGTVIIAQKTIAKTAHKYKVSVVAPTCTKKGYTKHTCSVCGTSYKDAYVDCIPHTEVIDAAVAATCNSAGKTEGKHCSVCGTVIVAQNSVPQLKHKFKKSSSHCLNGCGAINPSYKSSGTYEDVKYEIENGGATITKNQASDATEVVILSEIEGIPVTAIGNSAFKNCTELESVTIPDSVQVIGEEAFRDCYKLKSITIPEGVTTIGKAAFFYCEELKSVTIPNTVTFIGESAFEGCKSLKKITIPKSVETIEGNIFAFCTALEKITVDKENEYYATENGVLFNKDKTVLIAYPCNKADVNYAVPDGVKTIAEYAFYGYTICFETFTLPASLENIESIAFSGLREDNISIGYIKKVYYNGTDDEFNNISIGVNIDLEAAKKCFVTAKLGTTSYTYNKKANKPTVTVYAPDGSVISSKDYTVSYSKGRKKVGKYKVTVKLKNKYKGSEVMTFTVKPKSTSISSLKAGKKKLTVKWKKQKTQTSGYQLQYSTSSKFKKAKKVTIKKNSTTKKTIGKLKKNKKYYVRVRTYKTVKVNGKSTRIYSSWSKAKKIKVK